MDNHKKRYNEVLARLQKGYAWYDNPFISVEEKEKYYPAYEKLLIEHSNLLKTIKIYTQKEKEEGFRES
jgi:hypothetical protein